MRVFAKPPNPVMILNHVVPIYIYMCARALLAFFSCTHTYNVHINGQNKCALNRKIV